MARDSTMPIRPLPPLLVNQIAAGEVIERPASVVKELLENAIDAGATRIAVAIEQGGKALVRVSDDGAGIPTDELLLALTSHATSKITTADDLDMIATLGFRGEALASMASVSRIELLSRVGDAVGATVVDGEGGALGEPRPAAGPPGTSVTVRSLFFNTPARRKFLKTDQTETSRVRETIENIALAHPEIGFTLETDGRTRLELAPGQSARERVLAVVGEELADELLEVRPDDDAGDVRLWGLAGVPSVARTTSRHQRLFVNGRPIVDRAINHAIKEAYRGLIDPARSPTIVLYLVMDPAVVDVNVHPAKAEVRFRNASAVYRAVLAAVRDALRAADLTPEVSIRPLDAWRPPEFTAGIGAASGPPATAVVDSFHRLDRRAKSIVYSEVKAALAREAPEILEQEIAARADVAEPALGTVRGVRDALQVHSSYIVTEDADGIIIIDQHALHERVMFEELRARVETGVLESQRLLMPVVIEIDAAGADAIDTLQPLLVRLGIEVESMGPKAIGVHAFTSLLFERNVDPVDFMTGLVKRAVEEGLPNDGEAALHEVLDMMACKAAIKAGETLAPQEIEALLEHRDVVDRASNCPHGRPTTLRLSLKDLEKQFGRR